MIRATETADPNHPLSLASVVIYYNQLKTQIFPYINSNSAIQITKPPETLFNRAELIQNTYAMLTIKFLITAI